MQTRQKLGVLLAKIVRGAGRPNNNSDGARPNFRAYIESINLQKETAQEAQRIGTLPDADLERALAIKREADRLRDNQEQVTPRPDFLCASTRSYCLSVLS